MAKEIIDETMMLLKLVDDSMPVQILGIPEH
jgi:hypothetical protein